jgi:hypothetical protein
LIFYDNLFFIATIFVKNDFTEITYSQPIAFSKQILKILTLLKIKGNIIDFKDLRGFENLAGLLMQGCGLVAGCWFINEGEIKQAASRIFITRRKVCHDQTIFHV